MAVLTIYPYLIDRSCWVFDDERTGLQGEAFVLGELGYVPASKAGAELLFDVMATA